MAWLDQNDLDALRAEIARLKDDAAPVVDLNDLDALRAEIARLRDQHRRIDRQLELLDARRCRLEPRRGSAQSDAVDTVMAKYAAYEAVSMPAAAATPVPASVGKTVGEAAHAAEAWAARAEALETAYCTLDAGMREAWEAWLVKRGHDDLPDDLPDDLTIGREIVFQARRARRMAERCAEIWDDRRAGNRERLARHRARLAPATE
jgi:hypothetical protein